MQGDTSERIPPYLWLGSSRYESPIADDPPTLDGIREGVEAAVVCVSA